MIARDKVVSFKYVVRDSAGEEIDASGDDALEYLAGHGNIIPGLEKALEGLKVGDRKKVEVAAAEAYGVQDPELRFEVSLKNFGGQVPPEGAQVELRSEDGRRMRARVAEVKGDMVTLDGNHPLAGKDLHFDVEIAGIRDATADEISHGHVHGPHGHHHH